MICAGGVCSIAGIMTGSRIGYTVRLAGDCNPWMSKMVSPLHVCCYARHVGCYAPTQNAAEGCKNAFLPLSASYRNQNDPINKCRLKTFRHRKKNVSVIVPVTVHPKCNRSYFKEPFHTCWNKNVIDINSLNFSSCQ
jgi:hypothetical protein